MLIVPLKGGASGLVQFLSVRKLSSKGDWVYPASEFAVEVDGLLLEPLTLCYSLYVGLSPPASTLAEA